MAHLPVPVAWLGVVGRRRKLARKRRQNMEVAGVEEDGEQRSLQRLQVGEMASPERGGGLGGVAQAWEGLELPRRPEGIAGELELGDSGLPGQATAIYEIVECVGGVDGARGG